MSRAQQQTEFARLLAFIESPGFAALAPRDQAAQRARAQHLLARLASA